MRKAKKAAVKATKSKPAVQSSSKRKRPVAYVPEPVTHQMTAANEKLFPAMAMAPDASQDMMVARVISIMHAEARRLPDQMWPHTCPVVTTHRYT